MSRQEKTSKVRQKGANGKVELKGENRQRLWGRREQVTFSRKEITGKG